MGAEVGGDAYMVFVGMGEAKLKSIKEACTAGDGSAHEAEFAKDPLPGFDTDSLPAAEVIKDGEDSCFMVVSEFQCALVKIEHPAQVLFALHPAAISFQHLLFGDGLFPVGGSGGGWCEDAVNSVQDAVVDMVTKQG